MNKTSGFTLIELMIVVAIIGIIAAIGIPQMGKYFDRANDSKIKSAYMTFNKYAGIWSSDNGGSNIEKFTDFSSWFSITNSSQMQELIGATAEYISGTDNKEIYVYSGSRKARFYITQGAIFMDDIIDK